MWWNIIKNQSLATSQLGSTMNWEEEEVPDEDEEDDDCRRKLIEIYRRGIEKKNEFGDIKSGLYVRASIFNFTRTTLDYVKGKEQIMEDIPEEQACMILEAFKNNNHFYTHLRKPRYYSMHIEIIKNGWNRVWEGEKSTELAFDTPATEYGVEVILNDWKEQNEETKRKYIELCKYIFGTEYYDFTYEEVFGDL